MKKSSPMVKPKENIKIIIIPHVISLHFKMERNSSQKPENVATNMATNKEIAEIGNNADAVFPWAGAGAGAGDTSFTGPLVEASAACWGDGEACGERPQATKKLIIIIIIQLETWIIS